MDVQLQERTMYQHKLPPKPIETEKPGFGVNRLCRFGHVERSELYTGQILDFRVEGKRCRGYPKKYWLDAIKDNLITRNLKAETCQNRSEWRERLKSASHRHAGRV